MFRRFRCCVPLVLLALACGSQGEHAKAPASPAEQAPPAAEAAVPATPPDLPKAIVLALAQFVTVDGKPQPGPARMEFLYRKGGKWNVSSWEDPESNVFHKVMTYRMNGQDELLSLGGTAAIVKLWRRQGKGLVGTTIWKKDFGGKFSRMRDAEVADLYGDGKQSIAVATHDQGVVAVLHPTENGHFKVIQLDSKPNTFVHEIEIGDVNGDGVLEVYATPSEPNRLDGSPQSGKVVRYVPAKGGQRTVVADLGDRHAKEILVTDMDGNGRDELYVSVEGQINKDKQLIHPVEIRRYEADTPPTGGAVIATLDDRLCRFLTAGDIEGDGHKELVVASFSAGLWLYRPGKDFNKPWHAELIDRNSAGFEHAAILTDLDGDGKDELYVASDRDKEVRRYVWNGRRLVRQVIYKRPDNRPIFTFNIMPVPIGLVPEISGP